jgi:hypothetical protein
LSQYKERLSVLNEELILWEHKHKKECGKSKKYNDFTEDDGEDSRAWKNMLQQIERAQAQIRYHEQPSPVS